MSYGFGEIQVPVSYLRTAGLHQNAKLIGINYDATEQYEYFDIELEVDGKKFRERTFGPNPDKVYPKDIYENGEKVGSETKEEAFKRAINEVSTKLFYLGNAFVSEAELKASVNKAKDLKDFVEKVNKAINLSGNKETTSLNFLTIWKNNDTKKSSNLIIPINTKWVEASKEGQAPSIKLSKWQLERQMTEKYPYVASQSEAPAGNEAITTDESSDLPF